MVIRLIGPAIASGRIANSGTRGFQLRAGSPQFSSHLYFRDAALEWARGTNPTYPAWLPWPRIVLDHILTTPGMSLSNVRTRGVPGTDHLALLATLRY